MLKLAAPTLTAFALTSATSCTPAPAPTPTPSEPIERVERLLDESDNALRVALRKSLTDYFIYRGRPRGFEYDLLSRFAKTLDRRISVRVVTDDEQLEYLIERGEIDLWVPAEPWGGHPRWNAGPSYAHSDSVLVNWRQGTTRSVHVRAGSSPIRDLIGWCAPPCRQQIVAANTDWALLQSLAKTSRDQGVAVAVNRRHAEAFIALDGRFVITHGMGTSKPVRWWYRSADAQLKPALETFFRSGFRPKLRAALHARYFASPTQMRMRARPWVRTDLSKRITRWDPDLRAAQSRYGIDWRLLAAVMMVESAQDPFATSRVGAQGLFQFMPATARAIGLDDPSDPKASSYAAARYLRRLMRRFRRAKSPYDQRMFALASYNVGHAHLDDARILARQLGLDDEVWDQGVSLTLPLLAHRQFSKDAKHGSCQGLVATRYAEHVSDLYEQYSQILPQSLVDRDGGPERP